MLSDKAKREFKGIMEGIFDGLDPNSAVDRLQTHRRALTVLEMIFKHQEEVNEVRYDKETDPTKRSSILLHGEILSVGLMVVKTADMILDSMESLQDLILSSSDTTPKA